MTQNMTQRKATIHDLSAIIHLLLEDELGKSRESANPEIDQRYINAFHQINNDPHQYLMIVEKSSEIVGTCQLTIMPSLTFTGQTRMQIEAVRIVQKYRGQKIGAWMITAAINIGQSQGASIVQLTTHKSRSAAKKFYEKLGFEASHEGMKLYL